MSSANRISSIKFGVSVPRNYTYTRIPGGFSSFSPQLRGGLHNLITESFIPTQNVTEFVFTNFQELSAYYTYKTARQKFRNLADEFSNSVTTKVLVIDFLSNRESKNDLSSALALVKGLIKLKRLGVEGTKRVLFQAYNADLEGGCPNGYLTEVNTALSLIENGFTVHGLSVTQLSSGSKKIRLRSKDSVKREIDIIASKNFDEELVTFFIEIKSSPKALQDSIIKNDQIAALIEIADSFDAVPVIILKTSNPLYWRNGAVRDLATLNPSKDTVVNLLAKHTKLLGWDQNGNDLVSEGEVLKAIRKSKESYTPPPPQFLIDIVSEVYNFDQSTLPVHSNHLETE